MALHPKQSTVVNVEQVSRYSTNRDACREVGDFSVIIHHFIEHVAGGVCPKSFNSGETQ